MSKIATYFSPVSEAGVWIQVNQFLSLQVLLLNHKVALDSSQSGRKNTLNSKLDKAMGKYFISFAKKSGIYKLKMVCVESQIIYVVKGLKKKRKKKGVHDDLHL